MARHQLPARHGAQLPRVKLATLGALGHGVDGEPRRRLDGLVQDLAVGVGDVDAHGRHVGHDALDTDAALRDLDELDRAGGTLFAPVIHGSDAHPVPARRAPVDSLSTSYQVLGTPTARPLERSVGSQPRPRRCAQ